MRVITRTDAGSAAARPIILRDDLWPLGLRHRLDIPSNGHYRMAPRQAECCGF
jgi:hypothetical protein